MSSFSSYSYHHHSHSQHNHRAGAGAGALDEGADDSDFDDSFASGADSDEENGSSASTSTSSAGKAAGKTASSKSSKSGGKTPGAKKEGEKKTRVKSGSSSASPVVAGRKASAGDATGAFKASKKSVTAVAEGGLHEGAWKLPIGDLTQDGRAKRREQERLKETQAKDAVTMLQNKIAIVDAERLALVASYPHIASAFAVHDAALKLLRTPEGVLMDVDPVQAMAAVTAAAATTPTTPTDTGETTT